MFNFGRRSRRLKLSLLIVCYFSSAHTASAQLPQGRWTIDSTAACATQYYQWTVTHDEARFVDQRGNTDVERVVQWLPAGFVSETVSSASTPLQTRWEYQFLSPDSVRVKNLSNGRGFSLSRCPEISQTPNLVASTATAQPTLPSRIGPSFDCSLAKDALSGLICGSNQLAWLDLRFTQAYQALRQQVGEAGQPAVRQEAIDFQAQVYAGCRLPKTGFAPTPSRAQAEACVAQAYQQQRNLWTTRLSLPLQEEANRPLQLHLQLQANLQKLGFIPPASVIDGVYGPATRAAITAWQIRNSLVPTGVLSASDAQLLLGQATDSATTPPTAPSPSATSAYAPLPDEKAIKAAEDRRLAISQAEAEKAKAEAEKAEADAERARAEADVFAAKERAEADARNKAAEQARAEQDAHGIQP